MIIHPVWLTIFPIFFIETIFLSYLPIFGIVPPVTLIVMVLNVKIISLRKIWTLCLVFGYITDVLAGVDRGAHFIAWLMVALILTLIQLYDSSELLVFSQSVLYTVITIIGYQSILVLFALETGFIYWMNYLLVFVFIGVLFLVAINLAEKMIERVKS